MYGRRNRPPEKGTEKVKVVGLILISLLMEGGMVYKYDCHYTPNTPKTNTRK